MRKHLLCLCSIILTVALLFNMLPMHVLAQELDTDQEADVVNEAYASVPVSVLGEVGSLRQEDTKHFRLSDGSFVAVAYGLPIHYADEDGDWQDIDNSLIREESTNTYRIDNADTSVAFSGSLSDGTLFTTAKGNRSVSMVLLDTTQAMQMMANEGDAELDGTEELPDETTEPDETEETTIPPTEETIAVETVPEYEEPPVEETVSEPTTEETQATEILEETSSENSAFDTVSELPSEDESAEILSDETNMDTFSEESDEETVTEDVPEEATEETIPEATEEEPPTESISEETAPVETVPETVPEESTTDTEETPIDNIVYDREASAEIVNDVPTMLNLQDDFAWDVNDIIPENLQSSLLYKNVFPGIDLMYTTFGYNIKEQIVVNQPQTSYRYDFLLELNGLTAELNEDGSVSLMDGDGTEIYEIPIPYMEDSAGVLSPDVHFTLTDTTQGTILTVSADADWINDEERAFPVMIDPTIAIACGSALDDIYSVYTMEAAPNDTTLGRQYLYVGAQPYSTTNDGRYRIFMHFNDMPDIPSGSEVVDASLSLYKFQYVQRYCEQFPIGAYEVTSDKPSKYSSYYNWLAAMTWRNAMPSYDTTNAIDFAFGRAGKEYLTWNMTELVKKWYQEKTSNTTICLAMMNEDAIDTYYYFASATFYAYAGSIPPILTVSYRNNTGIEPYYTYNTLGAANAGTAYIADATGQLKIGKELLSYASSANPFSLNLIYNSDYFSIASGTDYQPPNKLGLSMNVGSGWTLDCIQKIVPETISYIDYLKYTDGDGTVHYFVKDSSKNENYFYDEDGLGLKIKNTGTNAYKMSDDKGNEWTFTDNYLTSIKDPDDNKINIAYSNGKLSSITQKNNGQSTIEIASFTYDTNNLVSVEDYAGNTYTFTYSGSNLTSIQKNNRTIASYSYSGYRLTNMTDSESGYGLAFTYANGKVSSYQEIANSNTGAHVAISYPNHSQTTYRDYGADRTSGTSDDILTHYLFDYAGRTANAYTTDNSGAILGATNAAYSGTSSTAKDNNRTVRSASIGLAGQQLMRDTSLEFSSSAWTTNGVSISGSKPRTGSHSIQGTLSSDGTQSAQTSSESLTAGKTYTFSGFVNTSDVSSFEGDGIYLKVSKGDSSWSGQPVNYTTAEVVDGGWVRVSVSFTTETDGAHTLSVHNDGAIGTFYADDFQLEQAEAPSSHNMIENGGMQMSVDYWTMGTNARLSTSRGAASSSASLKVTGDPESNSTNAYQDVLLNLPGTQTYVLSGWVYANAVPDDDTDLDDPDDTSKQCGLRATITYSDGSTEGHYVPFNPALSNTWQFASLTVVPKSPKKTVSKIRVTCAFEGNANFAYFDNISLLREAAQSMKYDKNGNLVSVTSPGLDQDVNTYSGGNLIKTVTGGNGTYTYTYDTTYKHRLTSVTNDLITQTMGYDGVGNVTSTTLSGSDGKSISTSAEYDESGNRLTSVTDATGAEVAYAYSNVNSQMMALPTAITDANGTVVTSSYDESYRVTETGIANVADISYTYNNGNLASVERTNDADVAQTYHFTYDSFGNMLTLKVGGRTLATYTYNSQNGLLSEQAYGNGDKVSFTYDNLGRTKTVTFADNRVMTYTYNGEGRLHSVVETGGAIPVTYLYTYDSLGRLISSEEKTGNASVLRTHQTYNENNQLTGQSWQMGSTAYSENYTYNSQDGSLNTMTTASGDTLTMNYDGLRRLSTVTGGAFDRSYTYRDISDSKTTLQVSRLAYPDLGSGQHFDYTYDALGNIATYTAPGDGAVTYTYDIQGQLLKAQGDTTYTYTYDTVGNILTASDGTTSHSYTYSDGDWKDLLTAYDGESITYDAIGNPISYYNGTRWAFTWSNGRNLTRAVSTGTAVDFTYDLEGLRTSKTVGGVTHNYLYAGGKLLRETDGTNTLDFVYDANGTPYALIHTVGTESPVTTTYYYITNLQGDVVQLVDSDGNAVASYEYDPYGKVISATGTLAEINPLRYRGYYYDVETGLYYLQSRYYDSTVGRYVNGDAYLSTGSGLLGYNMFAYCNNNPTLSMDSAGTLPSVSKFLATVAAGAAILTVAAICVVAAPVLIGVGSIAAAASAVASSAAVIAAATVTAVATATSIASAVVENKANQKTKSYTVYTLSNPDTKEVTYVGRTSNYRTRMAAHALNPLRKNLEPNIVYENLDYYQARAAEQILIIHYSTIDKTNKAKNQINGVNPNRKDYLSIMRKGFGITEALDSILTNELLIYFE